MSATTVQVRPSAERPAGGWTVVCAQELRELWLGGRGLVLALAFSVLLSVIAYLTATNQALNFLEQRESVNLTLQAAIAVGGLLALLAAADTISGERERGTLESMLLTPVSRLAITIGKLVASLSLWLVAYAITIPYVWFLGRGIGLVDDALVTGLIVGTLVAVFLASLGLIVSVFTNSNRVSLSVSLFLLLALYAPTQLPSSAQRGWAGESFLRVNPVTAGEHYVGKIVVSAHSWHEDASWLVAPLVGAAALACLAAAVGARGIRLRRGTS
jgi:ABC-2 type transport system permease protein